MSKKIDEFLHGFRLRSEGYLSLTRFNEMIEPKASELYNNSFTIQWGQNYSKQQDSKLKNGLSSNLL